jgi:hypothetical protein
MTINITFKKATLILALGIMTSVTVFAQKKKKPDDKLDTRFYDIEIRETTKEGKKYEKDVFEFRTKYLVSDYMETKLSAKTLVYTVTKDSTFTEDGDELKYFEFTVEAKTDKAGEVLKMKGTASGKDIKGNVELYKGDVVKKTFEFEGTEQARK